MIFADILKVLQRLGQSHIVVEKAVEKVTPLNDLAVSQLIPEEPKHIQSKDEDLLYIFKQFTFIINLWKELNETQDSEPSASKFIMEW